MPERQNSSELAANHLRNSLISYLNSEHCLNYFNGSFHESSIETFFKVRTLVEQWNIPWEKGFYIEQRQMEGVSHNLISAKTLFWMNEYFHHRVKVGHPEDGKNFYTPEFYNVYQKLNSELAEVFDEYRMNFALHLYKQGFKKDSYEMVTDPEFPSTVEIVSFSKDVLEEIKNRGTIEDLDTFEKNMLPYLDEHLPWKTRTEDLAIVRLAIGLRDDLPVADIIDEIEKIPLETDRTHLVLLRDVFIPLAAEKGNKYVLSDLVTLLQDQITYIVEDDVRINDIDIDSILNPLEEITIGDDVGELALEMPEAEMPVERVEEIYRLAMDIAEISSVIATVDPTLAETLVIGNTSESMLGILDCLDALPDEYPVYKIHVLQRLLPLVKYPQTEDIARTAYIRSIGLAKRLRNQEGFFYNDLIHADFARQIADTTSQTSQDLKRNNLDASKAINKINDSRIKISAEFDTYVVTAKHDRSALKNWRRIVANVSKSNTVAGSDMAEELLFVALQQHEWNTAKDIMLSGYVGIVALIDTLSSIQEK